MGPVTHVPASIRACRSRASARRPYDGSDAVLDARHRRPDLRRRFRRRRPGDAARPRPRRGAPELDVRRSAAGGSPSRLRARPPGLRAVAARRTAVDHRRQRRPADAGDHPALAATRSSWSATRWAGCSRSGPRRGIRAWSTRSCWSTLRCRRRVASFRPRLDRVSRTFIATAFMPRWGARRLSRAVAALGAESLVRETMRLVSAVTRAASSQTVIDAHIAPRDRAACRVELARVLLRGNPLAGGGTRAEAEGTPLGAGGRGPDPAPPG